MSLCSISCVVHRTGAGAVKCGPLRKNREWGTTLPRYERPSLPTIHQKPEEAAWSAEQPVAFTDRQLVGEVGLEDIGDVKGGAGSFKERSRVVLIGLELALRAAEIADYLAEGIVRLEVKATVQATADLNDTGVIS